MKEKQSQRWQRNYYVLHFVSFLLHSAKEEQQRKLHRLTDGQKQYSGKFLAEITVLIVSNTHWFLDTEQH